MSNSNIVTCPHCSTRSVLTVDGLCPSCRHAPDERLTPERTRELQADHQRQQSPSVQPSLIVRVIAAFFILPGASSIVTAIQILASHEAESTGLYVAFAAGLLFIPVMFTAIGILLWRYA